MHEISSVTGHRRWDSRGRPTVEVVVRTVDGALGRGIAPAGASLGSGEAIELRDGGPRFGGFDVTRAVAVVNNLLAEVLLSRDVTDQRAADDALAALGGDGFTRIGGNTAVATSFAVANASANASGSPLWQHLMPEATAIPLPEIQIFGGGAHAHGHLDLQDLLIVPVGAGSFAEALDWAVEIYRAAGGWLEARSRLRGVADEGGWWPAFESNAEALEVLTAAIANAGFAAGTQVGISLDVAATQLRSGDGYALRREERTFTREQWLNLITGWVDTYPILSIEDAFAEDDTEGMSQLCAAIGERVQVVGDDLLVTDADRVRAAVQSGAVNAVLVKPNQAGTLTRALDALRTARQAGMTAIVSARSGETEDVTIAHLAVGWAADGFKVGSVARGERTAKWNEMLRIEEQMGSAAGFVGRDGLGGRR